jgi:hypothetical protein
LMSAMCQSRHFAPHKIRCNSITSSAPAAEFIAR